MSGSSPTPQEDIGPIGAVFATDEDSLSWGERVFDRFVNRSIEM